MLAVAVLLNAGLDVRTLTCGRREESVKVQRVGRGKEPAAGVPPRQGRSSSRRWKKVDGPSRSLKEAAAKRSPSSPVTQGRGLGKRRR